ncbi:MAG: beta-ketoacyl-[acyl-carrier-protein] synthase family protein [Lentisphaerae bacterium]|nr:beta-ketoacyl-[acyl-carrier-protein] synthase family protein [Lentisphaerota bacterium]
MHRVAITGAGVLVPPDLDETALWETLAGGGSVFRRLRALDTEGYRTRNGAELDDGALAAARRAAALEPADRTSDILMLAARRALDEAGNPPGEGMGALVGTGHGAAFNLAAAYAGYFEKGHRGPRPSSVPRSMANTLSARLSMELGLTGPNYVTVAACASSTTALIQACRMIRHGYARRILCGGVETPFEPVYFSAWDNLRVMSPAADPAAACRPFDRNRNGFLLGEGAGALVLEAREEALARGARVRGELVGVGEASDATHITRPDPAGQARAMQAALDDAGLTPADIGFINAHGTATRVSDPCEAKSVRTVFGARADSLPVTANKACFGHLLGASGIVEAVVTLLSLEHGAVPPTASLAERDPECPLHIVRRRPAPLDIPCGMSNSFAFGGNNAVLILRA